MDFIKESPLATAKRAASDELKKKATSSEVGWLYSNPHLWLRALIGMKRATENHIAQDARKIATLKPPSGHHPTAEYIQAKQNMESHKVGRLHFLSAVTERIHEVEAILGPKPAIGHILIGEVAGAFASIAQLIEEGDLEGATKKSLYWSEHLND